MPGIGDILQSGSLAYTKPSPASVAARRALAEQLMQSGSVQNAGPFGVLANALGGSLSGYERTRAGQDESMGQEGASSALAQALQGGGSFDSLAGVAGNPWLNQGQSGIVNALLGQEIQQRDPAYQLDMQLKQAQLNQANAGPQPDYTTFTDPNGDMYRYDQNDPNAQPSMFFDVPDAAAAVDPKGEGSLRTEYNGINTVKDFGLQTQAYQRVLDSAVDPSPAGDLALIFNYMKVLDPGSTVREGEFATAQNSGSLPEQIQAQYNKVLQGTRLTPEIRKDFVNRAGQLFQGAAGLQEQTNDRYSGIATQYGYDPERIIADVPKIGILDPEFDVNEYLDPQTGAQTKPIPLTAENADAEYDALPSGAQFVGPDGVTRTKP